MPSEKRSGGEKIKADIKMDGVTQPTCPFGSRFLQGEQKKKYGAAYRLQITCKQLFDLAYPELKENLFYIPNQFITNDIKVVKFLKDMGMNCGVWQMHLMVSRNGYYGMWLEFKSEFVKLTGEQLAFRERNKDRYLFIEINCKKQFLNAIECYLIS